MSLYGALFSGVSGLQAQSSAMGAIADNVTNVNTIGYKSTQVNFQTLVTKQASLTKYSAGGVQSKPRQGVDVQGLLQSTTSATDISISGGGFFIVNESGSPSTGDIYAYSRAGSFRVDKEGNLQNTSGYYLQGWPLQTWDGSTQAVQKNVGGNTYMKAYQNSSGDTVYINDNIVDNTNLRPLNLKTIGGTAVATTTISMGANLPSSASVGQSHKTDVLIYDSLGAPHNINHTWSKRASNAWDLSVVPPKGAATMVVEDQTSTRNNYMSLGRLDFQSVPDVGTTMDMTVDGTVYRIAFGASDVDSIHQNTITVATQPTDGETYQIDIGGTVTTFEFDNDNSLVDPTRTRVVIGPDTTTTASNLANAIEAAMDTTGGSANWTSQTANAITFEQTNNVAVSFTDGTGGNITFAAGAAIATTARAGLTPVNAQEMSINVNNRSLSQIMDEVANRVQKILQYEYGGTPKSPPQLWAERIGGDTGVFFHNGSTANDITIDASRLTAGGVTAVTQNTAFTVERLDSSVAWTGASNYTVEFNGDGTPNKFFGTDEATASDPRIQYKIDWANGAEDMDGSEGPALSVSLGNYNVADGLTQFGDTYQINYISQNGASFGNFAGVTIGEDGVVTALFDNGVTRPVFMIPVATMVNPNGMDSLSGNVWIETDFSGQPTVREAGSAGSGSVQQSSLEASTVDLGEEFTSMITTQRAYSAAAKIISTSDEMLEELLRVKR
jgi:flagellar hook protein FlgE